MRAVTGGGGFLGSHLVDYLIARGDHVRAALRAAPSLRRRSSPAIRPPGFPADRCHASPAAALQVIVMDNFFTGSHANVAHHLGKPNFELLRHDIVEPILLEARARSGVRRLRAAAYCAACAVRAVFRPAGAGGVRLLAATPGCREADLTHCADSRAPDGAQVDQIYHLACPASPVHYKYNPVKTIKARLRARRLGEALWAPPLTRLLLHCADKRAGHAQHARPGQAREGAHRSLLKCGSQCSQ